MVPIAIREDAVIMVVDDSENDITIIVRAIQRAKMRNRIVSVSDGEEAMAYLEGKGRYADRREHPLPDLVLVDLKMPKVDGFELLAWIRGQPALKRLAVVVLTSSELLLDVSKAYELGANSFLVKPTEFEDLEAMVRTLGSVLSKAADQGPGVPE